MTPSSRIVVGFDGSPSSARAAEWAAAEAETRSAPLSVVTCHSPSIVDWSFGSGAPTFDIDDGRDAAAAGLSAIVESLRTRHPGLDCTGRLVSALPREALVQASTDAALVVVGRSGTGGVKRLLVGSVARAVVRHSRAPTVVVPALASRRGLAGRVVVGVDGSSAAAAAVTWARSEAFRRRSRLVVVHAWTIVASAEVRDRRARAAADAQVMVNRAVVCAAGGGRGVTCTGQHVEGSAAAALLAEAQFADLLVVGSRARGGWRSALAGSVAHAMTEHSPCPTVVVYASTETHEAKAG